MQNVLSLLFPYKPRGFDDLRTNFLCRVIAGARPEATHAQNNDASDVVSMEEYGASGEFSLNSPVSMSHRERVSFNLYIL